MTTSLPILSSQRKRALVIGNNNYSRPESKLRHCINDANDFSDLLKSINFNVTVKFDLANVPMVTTIRDFSRSIVDGDLVLFYFSGHGYQVKDKNFLMPIDDQEIETEEDVEDFAVCVETTMNNISKRSPSSVTLFILDCCRTYWPKKIAKTRGSADGKGLHSMEPPVGTFIQFACGPNRTACDGAENERNGLFTKHLLRHITYPNTDITQIFRSVAYDVYKESDGTQRPLSVDGILHHGHVCLNESGKTNAIVDPQPKLPAPTPGNQSTEDDLNNEIRVQHRF
ncbi:unnamed protein product [Adineta steineri]|uniref:Caspase family p20 domain-containing protein n=1 Tax=Adineta steineri TaxID=433720 RepID=A0A819HQZ7_9BILA|nr:unnamed protein product [Adineta steineri]